MSRASSSPGELAVGLAALDQLGQSLQGRLSGHLPGPALVEPQREASNLAEDGPVEEALLLDPAPHQVEQRAQQYRHRRFASGEGILEDGDVVAQDLLGDALEECVLAPEVVEDGRAGDSSRLGDIGHRDGVCADLYAERRRSHTHAPVITSSSGTSRPTP